jgi:hypothetical protein
MPLLVYCARHIHNAQDRSAASVAQLFSPRNLPLVEQASYLPKAVQHFFLRLKIGEVKKVWWRKLLFPPIMNLPPRGRGCGQLPETRMYALHRGARLNILRHWHLLSAVFPHKIP